MASRTRSSTAPVCRTRERLHVTLITKGCPASKCSAQGRSRAFRANCFRFSASNLPTRMRTRLAVLSHRLLRYIHSSPPPNTTPPDTFDTAGADKASSSDAATASNPGITAANSSGSLFNEAFRRAGAQQSGEANDSLLATRENPS